MADRLLNVAEVADRLGTWEESGERFPRRLIEERRIAFVKVGRYVRIRESVVEDYIAAHTVEPCKRSRARYGRAA